MKPWVNLLFACVQYFRPRYNRHSCIRPTICGKSKSYPRFINGQVLHSITLPLGQYCFRLQTQCLITTLSIFVWIEKQSEIGSIGSKSTRY